MFQIAKQHKKAWERCVHVMLADVVPYLQGWRVDPFRNPIRSLQITLSCVYVDTEVTI